MIDGGFVDGRKCWTALVWVHPDFARQLERETNRLEQFERRGDAVMRWMMTITATLCAAALIAAYAVQLAAK